MNLKKLLALGLALVMTLSLVACSGNKDDVKEPTENNPSVSTPTEAEPTDNKETKQKYYENYFDSADLGFLGESILAKAEGIEIKVWRAKDNTELFRTSIGETLFEIYTAEDGKQYIHIKTPASQEEEAVDAWYLYNGENADEDEKDAFDSIASDMETDTFNIDKELVNKITYVETDEENGLDHIVVSYKNSEYNPETTTTTYNIKFVYEGQECTMTVVHSEDGDGGYYNTFTDDDNVPEAFSALDYDIDFENNKWVAENEEDEDISFEVLAAEETNAPEFMDIDVWVTLEAHKIAKMTHSLNGVDATIEFGNPISCKQEVEVPETTEECDAETLAMLYFTVIFSAMESIG